MSRAVDDGPTSTARVRDRPRPQQLIAPDRERERERKRRRVRGVSSRGECERRESTSRTRSPACKHDERRRCCRQDAGLPWASRRCSFSRPLTPLTIATIAFTTRRHCHRRCRRHQRFHCYSWHTRCPTLFRSVSYVSTHSPQATFLPSPSRTRHSRTLNTNASHS